MAIKTMVELIRRSLEYQGVGRKLLMVDELPQGALDRYYRDIAIAASAIHRTPKAFYWKPIRRRSLVGRAHPW